MIRDSHPFDLLADEIRGCRRCSNRFAMTMTAHAPRPVFWCHPSAVILVAGQAPGRRVHASGTPFDDPSGARLRNWMGVSREEFYDHRRIAFLPMAFCFPGTTRGGSDLPPPGICCRTWHARVLAGLPNVRLQILLGGHAHRWHLGEAVRGGVFETVSHWRKWAPAIFALPHPSWRNNARLRAAEGFEEELLPALRTRVGQLLYDRDQ